MDLTTKVERLAVDLRAIAEGQAPTADDLERAPLLLNWRGHLVPGLHLVGDVIGQPLLGTTDIITSRLYWLAPQRRAARTLSRYYRLG